MFRLQQRGWPDCVARINEAALEQAVIDTLQCAESLLKVVKQCKDTQLAEIIRRGAKSLERVTVGGGNHPEYELDLIGAGDTFLELATDIETLLSDLLPGKEVALNVLRQEEALSNMMNKMNLAP